jgi:hypothetical protein
LKNVLSAFLDRLQVREDPTSSRLDGFVGVWIPGGSSSEAAARGKTMSEGCPGRNFAAELQI